MKILYHHRTMGDGAEGVHIREMVRALRDLRHEVLVVSIVGEPTEEPSPRAQRWQFVKNLIPRACYELAEIGYNAADLMQIERQIRRFQPDVIYDRYNSYSTAALRAARRNRRPLLLEVNAPVVYERTKYDFMRLSFPRLAESYERRILLGADHLVTVSTSLKDYLVRERQVAPHRISVIPNAINPSYFTDVDGLEIRAKYGLQQRTVVGFVGSLRQWHGLDLLMEIMPEVLDREPKCAFLIVGSGELESSFRKYVHDRRLSHAVTMTGWVPHSAVASYIAAMDITVMPHSNFYGSPIKIFEYMALGKAVIGPALGPLQEVIQDGSAGILVKPNDKLALREAVLMLARDESMRRKIGSRAKDVVFARHTWRKNAERTAEILERLTATS